MVLAPGFSLDNETLGLDFKDVRFSCPIAEDSSITIYLGVGAHL